MILFCTREHYLNHIKPTLEPEVEIENLKRVNSNNKANITFAIKKFMGYTTVVLDSRAKIPIEREEPSGRLLIEWIESGDWILHG